MFSDIRKKNVHNDFCKKGANFMKNSLGCSRLDQKLSHNVEDIGREPCFNRRKLRDNLLLEE